jgi:hypothetical protein
MNLDSPFALLFFILFLAPGLFFDFLSKRHRGSKKETQLQEFGKIVLASTIFSGLSYVSVFWIRYIPVFPKSEFKESFWHPLDLYLNRSEEFLKFLLLICALAFLYVLIYDNLLIALQDPKFTDQTIWTHFFSNTSPKEFRGWRYPFVQLFRKILILMRRVVHRNDLEVDDIETAVLVTTSDGKSFVGLVGLWSSEENIYGREIMLAPLNEVYLNRLPIEFRELYGKQGDWQKIWFPESSIRSIQTVYLNRS